MPDQPDVRKCKQLKSACEEPLEIFVLFCLYSDSSHFWCCPCVLFDGSRKTSSHLHLKPFSEVSAVSATALMKWIRQWVKSVHLTGFYQMTCNTPTLSTCFSLGGNSVVPLSLCLSTRSSLQNFVAGQWIQNDSPCTGEQLILRAACPRDSHPPHYNKWKSWKKFKKVWVFSSWQPSCTHLLLNCQPWGLKAIWRCSRNRNTSPAVEES